VTTPDPRPASTPGTDPLLGSPGGVPSAQPRTGTPPTGAPPTSPAPAPGPAPASERASTGGGTGRTIGRTLAAALLVFVTVVLVLFVMFNTQTVQVSLVFTDVQAPLVLALLIAAVLGGLVVALVNILMAVRRRRNR
jgi:uncharacterized integral membrane protein